MISFNELLVFLKEKQLPFAEDISQNSRKYLGIQIRGGMHLELTKEFNIPIDFKIRLQEQMETDLELKIEKQTSLEAGVSLVQELKNVDLKEKFNDFDIRQLEQVSIELPTYFIAYLIAKNNNTIELVSFDENNEFSISVFVSKLLPKKIFTFRLEEEIDLSNAYINLEVLKGKTIIQLILKFRKEAIYENGILKIPTDLLLEKIEKEEIKAFLTQNKMHLKIEKEKLTLKNYK
ncbi:hypothetical protein [Aureivirga sp. CE67]|uniref:hypothetical protein n=1 Tax=Aureivirga sp. CE67 TaxID=1788983 RepID=UPI0018CB292F|nr:hypothetical protein [Aureivirga sp. CE67]